MDKKGKFYTVWTGHRPGIYQNWKDCKAAILNFKGAQYKSFPTFEAAKKAFDGNYNDYKGKSTQETVLSREDLLKIGAPNYNSISVDAASSGNPGVMEYRGVDTRTKKELFRQGPFKQGTNNIGEFLALVHGLAYLQRHNSNRIIYTDSKTAISWVRKKKCNSLLRETPDNKDVFQLVERALNWLENNTYQTAIVKWETKAWGEIPADFGRK